MHLVFDRCDGWVTQCDTNRFESQQQIGCVTTNPKWLKTQVTTDIKTISGSDRYHKGYEGC